MSPHSATAADARLASATMWEVARLLLKAGAKINSAPDEGGIALRGAAFCGDAEIVELLLKGGAKVDSANAEGRTPLHEAASGGHVEVVNLLLKAGAKIDIANLEGRTPLHLIAAIELNPLDSTRLYSSSRKGRPYGDMGRRGKIDFDRLWKGIEELSSMGEVEFAMRNKPRVASGKVSHSFCIATAKALLDANADVHARDNNKWTPLHASANSGNLHLAWLLLKYGAETDLVAKDVDGRTPLQLAAVAGHTKMILAILAKQASLSIIEPGAEKSLRSLLGLAPEEAEKMIDYAGRTGGRPGGCCII